MASSIAEIQTVSPLDQHDLVRRLCHALDIAHRAIELLGEDGYIEPGEDGRRIMPEKVITETAMLLLTASHAGDHAEVRERIASLARIVSPLARSVKTQLALCLNPPLGLDYAIAHRCLSRLGYHDNSFDRLLAQTLQAQCADSHERIPFRCLEHEWAARAWTPPGIKARPRDFGMVRRSILNSPLGLLTCSREDFYAYTHALLYISDFATNAPRLPRPRMRLIAEGEAALAWCLDQQDYDLGAEMLMAWPVLRCPWNAAAAFGFRVLARVEDAAGFLPIAATRLDRYHSLAEPEKSKYLLATAYHTAYVMGFLCAIALRHKCAPPQEIPIQDSDADPPDDLLRFLEDNPPAPHWRAHFDELAPAAKAQLTGLLITIALQRAVAAKDFDRLRAILETSCRVRTSLGPAVEQAAELLQSLALFSRSAAHSN